MLQGPECPVPAVERARQRFEQLKIILAKLRDAGVRIAMGTDAGTPGNDHGANADEVVAMVEEAGLTPQQSIRAATAGAALLLRREADLGSLAPGRFADVIGCLGDPTKDIAQITRLVFVMKGGRVIRDDR